MGEGDATASAAAIGGSGIGRGASERGGADTGGVSFSESGSGFFKVWAFLGQQVFVDSGMEVPSLAFGEDHRRGFVSLQSMRGSNGYNGDDGDTNSLCRVAGITRN